jgi:osmotically-inducible protein OsmY
MRNDYKVISFEKSQDRRLAVRVSAFLTARFGRKISHKIEVESIEGLVYLRGEVSNKGVKDSIVEAVKSVPGVEGVVSKLNVPEST